MAQRREVVKDKVTGINHSEMVSYPEYKFGEILIIDSCGDFEQGFYDGVSGSARSFNETEGRYTYRISTVECSIPEKYLRKLSRSY